MYYTIKEIMEDSSSMQTIRKEVQHDNVRSQRYTDASTDTSSSRRSSAHYEAQALVRTRGTAFGTFCDRTFCNSRNNSNRVFAAL